MNFVEALVGIQSQYMSKFDQQVYLEKVNWFRGV